MDTTSIVAAYKRYARNYDLIFGGILNPGRRLVVEKMNCLRGQRILEAGVGTGLSLHLYPKHTAVVGINVSPHMLARAHKRVSSNGLRKAALSLMDAQIMSFAEGSFDKVVAMYVPTVVPDPQAMVSEMKRVCKHGGDLLFVNHFSDDKRLTKAYEALFSPLAKKNWLQAWFFHGRVHFKELTPCCGDRICECVRILDRYPCEKQIVRSDV